MKSATAGVEGISAAAVVPHEGASVLLAAFSNVSSAKVCMSLALPALSLSFAISLHISHSKSSALYALRTSMILTAAATELRLSYKFANRALAHLATLTCGRNRCTNHCPIMGASNGSVQVDVHPAHEV